MISLYRSVLLAISISSLLLYCSPRQCGFSANHLYSRDKFSGSDLYEKNIGICPLLKGTGYDTVQLLSSDNHFEELKKVRSDLHFTSVMEMEKHFLKKWDQDSLQLFYSLLFRGEIAVLQTHDSLWSAVKSDYYMVMRLADASTVKTFNNTVRKRLHLEAELWDCKDQEVLWRTRVKGICVNSKIPDRQFLMEAIKSACNQLPAILPSYGNQPWWKQMRECAEKIVKIGFSRPPKVIFDEVESVTAQMIRLGWYLKDSCIEDGLGFVHLFFEREIDGNNTDAIASL